MRKVKRLMQYTYIPSLSITTGPCRRYTIDDYTGRQLFIFNLPFTQKTEKPPVFEREVRGVFLNLSRIILSNERGGRGIPKT